MVHDLPRLIADLAQASQRLAAALESGGSLPPTLTLPVTMRDLELRRMIGIGHSAFYKRKANGDFRFLELQPQLADGNTVYSGNLVRLWLQGVELPPRSSRFFQAGVKKKIADQLPTQRKRRPGRPRKSE